MTYISIVKTKNREMVKLDKKIINKQIQENKIKMNELIYLNTIYNKNINEVNKQRNIEIDLYNSMVECAKRADSNYILKSIISLGIYHILFRNRYNDDLDITLGAINNLAEKLNASKKYIENLESKIEKNKKKITYYENYIEKLQLLFESSNENQKIKKLSKD